MVMEERWAMSHSSPVHGLFVSNEWWLHKRKEFQNKGVHARMHMDAHKKGNQIRLRCFVLTEFSFLLT